VKTFVGQVHFLPTCPGATELKRVVVRTNHGVISIPELELMVNSGIGIDYLKKNGIENF